MPYRRARSASITLPHARLLLDFAQPTVAPSSDEFPSHARAQAFVRRAQAASLAGYRAAGVMSETSKQVTGEERGEGAREFARRVVRGALSRCTAIWDTLDSNRTNLKSARAVADAAVATAAAAHERLRE